MENLQTEAPSLAVTKAQLSFETLGFDALVTNYLKESPDLKPFYQFSPSLSSFEQAVDLRKSVPCNRDLLSEVILAQYSGQAKDKVLSNIKSLSQDNTFTVTTGHQLNIFTGPLYFIYKILSTVRTCQYLIQKFPGLNFVPIYWMASEDHDFAEISTVNIFGKTLKWESQQHDIPSGRLNLKELQPVIDELSTILGTSQGGQKLSGIISEAYRQPTLAQAHRRLVDILFSEYGVITIDGDDKKFKKLFIPVIQEEFKNQLSFHKVSATISELEKSGYKAQVQPREINLFYFHNDLRKRIVEENKGGQKVFKVLDTEIVFNEADILKEAESFPERFSPNVVLRPVYQEILLPNLAYIGGPAEIAYWLEYKGLFDQLNVFFPMLLLRNCALWLDKSQSTKLDKFEITPAELFEDVEHLISKKIKEEIDIDLSGEYNILDHLYQTLIEKASKVDPTLKSSVEGDKKRQLEALKSIEDRIIRAEKKKSETEVQQIRALREKLFPSGSLQERFENFCPFYLRYGRAFFSTLLSHFEPVVKEFILLKEENR